MAFRLASARSERFAALAVVASHCWHEPGRLKRALPTLLVAGTMDPLLPLAGGLAVLPWEIRASPPLEASIQRWAGALGVSPKGARVRKRKSMTIQDYGQPGQAAALRVVLLEGHGHGWPGHPRSDPLVGRRAFYGPRAEAMDATRLVWEFLRVQSIPAGGGPAR
jgi:polyhydroxybutyrate depolymerase